MISKGKFETSFNDAKKLLQKLALYKDIGPRSVGDYSQAFKKICRSCRHIDIYNAIRDNLDYEFVLSDDSFFQFSFGDKYLRYCYIENPNISYSKKEYLKTILPDLTDEEIDDDLIADLVKEHEYEQFLNETEINSNLLYVRYDFDVKGYVPLLHSCSHLHIGMRESVRIPLSKALTPRQFVAFCVKLAYPEIWEGFHDQCPDNDPIHHKLQAIKNENPNLGRDYWDEKESSELYLQ